MTRQNNLTDDSEENETLLTKKALQLSLSPPRAPPFGTAQHSILSLFDPSKDPFIHRHDQEAYSDYNCLMHLVYNSRFDGIMPHPHLSRLESADKITRFLGSILPVSHMNEWRDNGTFRRISDRVVKATVSIAAIGNPRAAIRFLDLTNKVKVIRYGKHKSQFIDMFFPENIQREELSGLIIFVHGGAWGSGATWMYRLVVPLFLKKKFAVAVVGYRVYPDGNVTSQVLDLEAAYDKLSKLYPDLCGQNRQKRDKGVIVIGHSSGAHIGLLMIVQQIKRSVHVEDSAENISFSNNPFVDKFIGMSGPYSISHHFDYEAARGVEELSPMKPACGFSREQFRTNSPAIGLQDFMTSVKDKGAISRLFPRSLLVHGIEDGTVPFTATSECARTLRSCGVTNCEEYYAPRTSHEDTVVQLMLGGRVSRAIADWLSVSSGNEKHLRSKL